MQVVSYCKRYDTWVRSPLIVWAHNYVGAHLVHLKVSYQVLESKSLPNDVNNGYSFWPDIYRNVKQMFQCFLNSVT